MEIQKQAKRNYLKAHIWIARKLSRKEKPSTSQLKAAKIFRKMVESPESEMMIAPISQVHYVHWRDIFVKHGGDRLQIINGKYFYDISLTIEQSDELFKLFTKTLEDRRMEMEKEIMVKTSRSLDTILEEMECKKEHNSNNTLNNE